MATPKWHIERVSEQLLREIGTVIAQEIRDPRIPDIVTITEVKLAKDVRNATVYASIMGDANQKRSGIEALNKAAPFIQRIVASRVVMKNFPHLIFKLDTSIEYGQHMNDLFKEISQDLQDEQDNQDGQGGQNEQDDAD
jgi:ribosome-binding factor A